MNGMRNKYNILNTSSFNVSSLKTNRFKTKTSFWFLNMNSIKNAVRSLSNKI